MTVVEEILSKRGIPKLPIEEKSGKDPGAELRKRLLKIVSERQYGIIPKCEHLDYEIRAENLNYFGGKAIYREILLTLTVNGEKFSFPVYSLIPGGAEKCPAFLMINFRDNVPDRLMPSEEIIDNGFAVFSFCYNDVTKDNGDFSDGIARILRGARRTDTSPGKIAMWAFAAMRVMDFIETVKEVDKERVAVIGHSRLGKTALLAGATDTRFKYVISNDSGCCGAALTRGKVGESVSVITNTFPHWFCPRFVKRAALFEEDGFDQHFLMALIAPRHLLIGSAEEDLWADPESEFFGALATSEAYNLYGVPGLIHKGEIPKAPTVLDEGRILYHLRRGGHWMNRDDWQVYMNYIKKN